MNQQELWKQLGNPVNLPLVRAVPSGGMDNPSLSGASTPPTLMAHLETQSEQILALSLTVEAAQQLVKALAVQLLFLGYPIEQE